MPFEQSCPGRAQMAERGTSSDLLISKLFIGILVAKMKACLFWLSRSALNIGAFEATQLVSHLPAIRDTGRSFGQNELSHQKVVSQSYHLSLSKPSFQVELYVLPSREAH